MVSKVEKFGNAVILISVKTIRLHDNDMKTIENDMKTYSCRQGLIINIGKAKARKATGLGQTIIFEGEGGTLFCKKNFLYGKIGWKKSISTWVRLKVNPC